MASALCHRASTQAMSKITKSAPIPLPDDVWPPASTKAGITSNLRSVGTLSARYPRSSRSCRNRATCAAACDRRNGAPLLSTVIA
jgi:hypothetical protein